MTLIDTSAWVEYLRATGSRADHAVQRLVRDRGELATTEIVVMELLAGARDDAHVEELRRLLGVCEFLPIEGLADYEAAADLYRICRRAGVTIRSLTDCLVAAVAMRADLVVLQHDRDFVAMAAHVPLRLAEA